MQSEERFTFKGNTASFEGQDINSFSLKGCLASNFIPEAIAETFLPIRSDGTVVHEISPLQSTSTGPTFLYLYGASSKCYKSVNGITYLLPNCSNSLLNST